MLMALGVSALTAAGLNFGVSLAQNHQNQLNLYSSIMDRTIRAAMEADPIIADLLADLPTAVPISDAYTLGSQIIAAVLFEFFYYMATEDEDEDEDEEYEINWGRYEITWTTDFYISLHSDISGIDGLEHEIIIRPRLIVSTNEFSRGPTATRFYAWVSGDVVIEQTTKFTPPDGQVIYVVTRTIYELLPEVCVDVDDSDIVDTFYTGALFREEVWTYSKTYLPEPEDIVIVNSGTWRVVSHEIIN